MTLPSILVTFMLLFQTPSTGTINGSVVNSVTGEALVGAEVALQKFMCTSCGFIYDPAEGDPDGGIPPGTAFEDIPDDWFCPVCGARKRDFEPFQD